MSAADDAKRTALRKMQLGATALLMGMLALMFVSAMQAAAHPWLHWVRALAEAGAIGATADWYAVVALFRRPLGLPMPHSAIIPANKDRIGTNLGAFVEQNFLTAENIVPRLRQHNVAAALARWLADARNRQSVARAVCEVLPSLLRAVDDHDLRRRLEGALKPLLLRLDVPRSAAHWLDRHKGLVRAKFSETSRYTPALLDDYIVDRFIEGVSAMLREAVANPQHELRLRLEGATAQLASAIWSDLSAWVLADVRGDRSMLREHMAAVLGTVGREILADPALQHRLNAWWLDVVQELLERPRRELSTLIADVVRSWDAHDVASKVELEIGRDLQFIRINGTLVGGLMGLLLHAAMLAVG